MSKIKTFAVLVMIALIALVGMDLTIHSGEVNAVVQGDANFRNRYVGIESTTPITDINLLNGASSNIQDQIDAAGTGTLAVANVFVGSASAVATAKSVTIINDVTATLDENGIMNATIPASTITSDMLGSSVVNSGKLDRYTLSLLVAATETTNSVSGDSSDLYTGALLTTIGGINGANLTNDVYHDGFGNFIMSMVNAVSADAVWELGFINTN